MTARRYTPGSPHAGYQHQQPYDWRYATQQQQQAYRQAYDPYRGAPEQPTMPLPAGTACGRRSVPAQAL